MSSRYSEGHVQAGHASLGETDVCDVHREDRRGKLHRVHLQTLRVSFQGGAESVSVDPEFSSDLVIARDDTVTQQWLHFPSCPAPVSPSHQSHRAVEGFVCLCSFFLLIACRSALFCRVAARRGHSVFLQWWHFAGRLVGFRRFQCSQNRNPGSETRQLCLSKKFEMWSSAYNIYAQVFFQ